MGMPFSPPAKDLFSEGVIRSYVKSKRFIERSWLVDKINNALDQPGCHFVLLTSEPGAGKSAFMAWLASQNHTWPRYFIRRDQQTPFGDVGAHSFLLHTGFQIAGLHPDLFDRDEIKLTITQRVEKVTHSGEVIGAEIDKIFTSPFYQMAVEIQQQVMANQGSVTGLKIGEWVTDPRLISLSNLQYMALLDPAAALQRLHPETRLVVLVDALDELRYRAGGETLLDWLTQCPELPENLRFVLSSRDDKDLLSLIRKTQGHHIVEVGIPTDDAEVRDDLKAYAQKLVKIPAVAEELNKTKTTQQFIEQVWKKADGNLGYLDALGRAIDQAIEQNENQRLTQLLSLSELPQGLQSLYAFFLQQIKTKVKDISVEVEDAKGKIHFLKAWPAIYRRILSVLSVAREPLDILQIRLLGGISPCQDDVNDAMETLNQFLDKIGDNYRLYHATLPEFLTSPHTQSNPDNKDLYVNPVEWHCKLVNYYKGRLSSWSKVAWMKMDDYGLRQLVGHLYSLREDTTYRQELHALVEDFSFRYARIQRWSDPNPVLADLRLAIDLALENGDLATAWNHIRTHRDIAREEQQTERIRGDVFNKKFQVAMSRTILYSQLPNSQALMRLWIAWKAASVGLKELATNIAQRAIDSLPPRGLIFQQQFQADDTTQDVVQDSITETLQRLLIRLARTYAASMEDQKNWLAQVTRSWPDNELQALFHLLEEPLGHWGKVFEGYPTDQPFNDLVVELRDKVRTGEQSGNLRMISFYYHRHLAAYLYDHLAEVGWQNLVEQAVQMVALDDYPSYREMALAWMATAVLAKHPDEPAQDALARVLSGALDHPEPGFWGDTIATAFEGLAVEADRKIDFHSLLSILPSAVPDWTIQGPKVEDDRLRAGLPPDPWAHSMLRRNAVAAVLYRQGFHDDAFTMEAEASGLSYQESYAGFRVLARLGLACRYLEWDQPPLVGEQLSGAQDDAIHMQDQVLGRERATLVETFDQWVHDIDRHFEHESLLKAGGLTGLQRSIYIQFLSALWHVNPERLRLLVPLAIDETTAIDAVFARLSSTFIGKEVEKKRFVDLVKTMGLETYKNQVFKPVP
jgi:hypothetical protein